MFLFLLLLWFEFVRFGRRQCRAIVDASHSLAHIVANSLRFCFCALTMLTFSLYAIVKFPYNTNFMCGVCECAPCIPIRAAKNTGKKNKDTQNGIDGCIRRGIHHRHQAPVEHWRLCACGTECVQFLRIRAIQRIGRPHRKNHVRRVKETMSAVI